MLASEDDLRMALRRLRPVAAAELERLETQRRRLTVLLAFIDEYSQARSAVIEIVRERPGIRASMVAIALGRSPQQVAEELAGHEREGRVRRQDRGWRTP